MLIARSRCYCPTQEEAVCAGGLAQMPDSWQRHWGDGVALADEALGCPQCVISVMGDHAGEGVHTIFDRKTADIGAMGRTFWVAKSPKARPPQVRSLCGSRPAYVIFVEPAAKGGARPTVASDEAQDFSINRNTWSPLPSELGPVTGRIDGSAAALVFDMIETGVGGTVDLWDYADHSDTEKPLRFILGCSTVCAVRKNMTQHPQRMKSRYRAIVAVARLAEPYCVWLR